MFTKTVCKAMREDINKALEAVNKKYKVELRLGNISFSENEFSGKLTASTVSEDGENLASKSKFEVQARLYGLEPSDYGKVITSQQREFKIVGINSRKRKFPIEVQALDNNGKYGMTEETVQRALLALSK